MTITGEMKIEPDGSLMIEVNGWTVRCDQGVRWWCRPAPSALGYESYHEYALATGEDSPNLEPLEEIVFAHPKGMADLIASLSTMMACYTLGWVKR